MFNSFMIISRKSHFFSCFTFEVRKRHIIFVSGGNNLFDFCFIDSLAYTSEIQILRFLNELRQSLKYLLILHFT